MLFVTVAWNNEIGKKEKIRKEKKSGITNTLRVEKCFVSNFHYVIDRKECTFDSGCSL